MVYLYMEKSVDPAFVNIVFETLQTDIMFVDNPSDAQISITTSYMTHDNSFLFVCNQDRISYPPLLPSNDSGCIVVNPDTLETEARDISYLAIMVTGQCNTWCSYCGLDSTRESLTDTVKAISTLREFYNKYKVASIRFTGGEPTLNLPLIQQCIDLFGSTRKGISTNGILFKDLIRVPVGWMGFESMCVHYVKYLKEDSCEDMFGNELTYDEAALSFRHKYGSSNFFNIPILVTKENLSYVGKFLRVLKSHRLYNTPLFVETDRYGNFNVDPEEIRKIPSVSQRTYSNFLYNVMRNKYMSLYYRAPYNDFVDSCYEVVGKENKGLHWIERMANLPFDLSVVSYMRNKHLIS